MVPQKAVLFKGTIRSNLQWGKPDATEEEMWKAIDIAQAREVVEGRSGGLDADITQNGKNLSGGQRQRLTIARALVRCPEILILDDSASALDYATDAKLRGALKELEEVSLPLSCPREHPPSAMRIRSSFWMTDRWPVSGHTTSC